jgi:hypothetical protein
MNKATVLCLCKSTIKSTLKTSSAILPPHFSFSRICRLAQVSYVSEHLQEVVSVPPQLFCRFLAVSRGHLQFQAPQSHDVPRAQTLDAMFLFTVTMLDQVKVNSYAGECKTHSTMFYLLISLTSMPLATKKKGAAR